MVFLWEKSMRPERLSRVTIDVLNQIRQQQTDIPLSPYTCPEDIPARVYQEGLQQVVKALAFIYGAAEPEIENAQLAFVLCCHIQTSSTYVIHHE